MAEKSLIEQFTTGPTSDMFDTIVNKPPHYNASSLECIDAMKEMAVGILNHNKSNKAVVIPDPHQSYCWQTVFKYIWRWPYKNGLEDLKKARWYLDRLIESLEAQKR